MQLRSPRTQARALAHPGWPGDASRARPSAAGCAAGSEPAGIIFAVRGSCAGDQLPALLGQRLQSQQGVLPLPLLIMRLAAARPSCAPMPTRGTHRLGAAAGDMHRHRHCREHAEPAVRVQLAGVVIAPVAVLFMCYALFQYKRRTRQVPSAPAWLSRAARSWQSAAGLNMLGACMRPRTLWSR